MKENFKQITLTGYVFYCPLHYIDRKQCKISQEFSNKYSGESCPICSEFHLCNWKILYVPYKNGYVLFDGFNVGYYENYFCYKANDYYLNIEDSKIFNELKDGEKVRVSGYISRTSKKTVFVKNVTRLNEENLIHITKKIVNKKYKYFKPDFNNPKTECHPNYSKKTNWYLSLIENSTWLKIDTVSSK